MSEDRLLSVLNASESVRNEDYDADEMLDPTKSYKTIRDIRNKNCHKNLILRDLDFTFDPEKDHYEPKKLLLLLIIIIINMKELEIQISHYRLKNILI